MRVLAAVSLGARFALGAGTGAVLGVVFFVLALVRGARPVHAEGALCRGRLIPGTDPLGRALAGPVLVRFSGAFTDQRGVSSDVLGVLLRLRTDEHQASEDPRVGDQDLLLATFESFRTAGRDRAATCVTDYLANCYSSVARWWIPGHGPGTLRLTPVTRVANPTLVTSQERGQATPTRVERLDVALAQGPVALRITVERAGAAPLELAELHLEQRIEAPDHRMQASMFNCGRGVRPVGFRNGVRATLYPMSQFGRRLRGR